MVLKQLGSYKKKWSEHLPYKTHRISERWNKDVMYKEKHLESNNEKCFKYLGYGCILKDPHVL